MTLRRQCCIENTVKTIVVFVFLLWAWEPIKNFLTGLPSEEMDTILKMSGYLLVGSIAGGLNFSYGKGRMHSGGYRVLAHLVAAILLVAVGLLIEVLIISVAHKLPGEVDNYLWCNIVFLAGPLLYAAIIGYDWWDLLVGIKE